MGTLHGDELGRLTSTAELIEPVYVYKLEESKKLLRYPTTVPPTNVETWIFPVVEGKVTVVVVVVVVGVVVVVVVVEVVLVVVVVVVVVSAARWQITARCSLQSVSSHTASPS